MSRTATHAEFDTLDWHDNSLYALRIDVGDITQGDWRSELVLDIDFIVEWVRGEDGSMRFRVAPATLVFHDVTDLALAVDYGDSGHRTMMNEMSIAAITRERIADQKICLDRPYWRWRIALNWPRDGAIGFGASGFTQTLRTTPILCDEQKLAPGQRV